MICNSKEIVRVSLNDVWSIVKENKKNLCERNSLKIET